MKYLIGTGVIVITLFIFILFYPLGPWNVNEIVYDDEQEGLSEQIVIRFSHVVAENTPKGLAAQKFAELAAEKTNGLVKVEVVPNGSMYTDEEEFVALENNDVQMIAPSLSKLTKLAPEWGLFDLPFLFHDYQDIEAVLSSEIGNRFLKLHEEDGIMGLALWSNGFKQMTSSITALQEPSDFAGQRFRIMPSAIIKEQFGRLGAHPVSVPFDQLYTALAEDAFDGQENTISNIYSRRIYGLQTHMTISNHGFLGYAILINKGFWDDLPKDVQASIQEAMDETTLWMTAESQRINDEQLQLIEQESSIEIHYLTEKEKIAWIEKLTSVYDSFIESINDESLQDFTLNRLNALKTQ